MVPKVHAGKTLDGQYLRVGPARSIVLASSQFGCPPERLFKSASVEFVYPLGDGCTLNVFVVTFKVYALKGPAISKLRYRQFDRILFQPFVGDAVSIINEYNSLDARCGK